MKKIITIVILLLLAVALVFSSVLAQEEDEVVKIPYPSYPDPTVYSDQTIVLRAGWSACRRGAVQNILTATNIS